MLKARKALREIYANAADAESIKWTLDEMYARGLPWKLYRRYLDEAERLGLIPVAGKSIVGGRVLTKEDILTRDMILETVKEDFSSNRYFYGVG